MQHTMADKGSLLTRTAAIFGRVFLKRELVGVDNFGNKYYKKYEENVLNEPIERRWVQTPDGLYDPDAVPPEWYQWLRKRRDAAPTLQEIQQMGAHRVQIAQRAAQLQADEAKRRFQASTADQEQASSAEGPNMQRFVQQLTGKGFANDADPADVQTTSNAPEDDSSQPSGWQPSSGPPHIEKREVPVSATMDGKEQQSSASTEPKLSDNSFQPEAWNPNKS